MLALDFDGVVVDALLECAAVTWYGQKEERGGDIPHLPDAATAIPQDFIKTFRKVRAYCRTMDDFMVTHELYQSDQPINRATFEAARRNAGPNKLTQLAEAAERVRAKWREEQFDLWIDLHTVQPEMADLIANTNHSIIVVSAKDSDSIATILSHHNLADKIDHIEGSCRDKRGMLQSLIDQKPVADNNDIIFVDDSIQNVSDTIDLPLRSIWADWGYHAVEDLEVAHQNGIRRFALSDVESLKA